VDPLRVRVLGGLEVEGIDPGLLGSRKARRLLKVLALARGRPVTVDALVDCLWPVDAPNRPADQVRVLVSRLRGVLGADRLPRSDAGYALVVDWLDLDALADLVDEAGRRAGTGSFGLARAAASAALALGRGPLLPDEMDAPWAEADRAAAERLTAAARRFGAEAALAAGDLVGAAELAEGALDHDPYDEVVLRILMTALARSGRPASALAAYAEARQRLADELGVSPTGATETLHTSILVDEPLAPSAASQRLAPDPASTLPGRTDALAVLDAALDAAADGRGGLVVVEGEAGIGKSRLLSTWGASALAAGATVLQARCEELARSLPLQAVMDALEAHVRHLGASVADDLLGPQADLLAPLLGHPTAGLEPVPAAALRDLAGGQQLLFAALVAVLGRLPSPAVLLLDDIHLAGSSTIEWLNYAARKTADLPLLLVVAQRLEEGTPIPAASTTVRLGPIDEAAAAMVVGPDRAAELVARSGGNPLLLVELAAADPSEELPNSVREAVAARCERAGPSAANTLRTAAVIGTTIDLDLLAAVLHQSPVALLDHLEAGVRRGLLVEGAQGFTFRHNLIRDALEAATNPARRTVAHREAGRALATRAQPDTSAVAHHALLGDDDELAASALIEAAAVASARYDQPEALRLLDQSLALRDSLAGRLLRARVHTMFGHYEDAGLDVDAALLLGGGSSAFELGAWAAHYRRDFAKATRFADEGVRVATDEGSRVGCLTIGAWVRQVLGDLPGAEQRLEEADRLARGAWRPVTSVWMAGLRVHQGRDAEAIELLQPDTITRAVAAHGSPALQAQPALHAFLFSSLAFANLGRPQEALATAAAIDDEEARTWSGRWAGRADNLRGWILRGLCEWGAADEANARGLERSTAVAMSEPMSHAHLDLASGALLAGDLDRASAEVAAAEALGDRHALAWRHVLRARLYRGEIALAAGDATIAADLAEDVHGVGERIGAARYVALGGLLLVRARLALGQPIDLAETQVLLDRLGLVAGMEAWRVTAAVAAAAGEDRWWTLAETRVAALSSHAGPHARTFQRGAGATLDRMRTAGRSG
jgi:DNA-binding SARP family transcriptional activator